MSIEKKAFLAGLANIALPIAGSMLGQGIAEKRLAPVLANWARKSMGRGKLKNLINHPDFITRRKNKTLNWLRKKRNAENLTGQLGMIPGAAAGGIATIPFNLFNQDNAEATTMPKYSQLKLCGFLKAAASVELSGKTTADLLKRAFSSGDLSPDDIALIRAALQEKGVPAPYADPYGPTNANYNQNILKARDESMQQIPEVQGASSAIRHGVGGAALGGVGGYALGNLLHSPNVLGGRVPYGLRSSLPKALGLGGAALGGLLASLPKYKQKVDEVKGLQKLNDPNNMENLLRSIETDKALLSS
jgi:hypothetical protein